MAAPAACAVPHAQHGASCIFISSALWALSCGIDAVSSSKSPYGSLGKGLTWTTLTQNQLHYFLSPHTRHPHVPANVQVIEFKEQFLLEAVSLHVGKEGRKVEQCDTYSLECLQDGQTQALWEGEWLGNLWGRDAWFGLGSGQQLFVCFVPVTWAASSSLHICWRGRVASASHCSELGLGRVTAVP